MNKRTQKLFDCVKDNPKCTAKKIANRTGIGYVQTATILKDLFQSGMLKRRRKGRSFTWTAASGAKVDDITESNSLSDSLTVKEKFNFMGKLTEMVIKGISPALIISGDAGVGKTYMVTKCLKDANLSKNADDYTIVKGHSSPLGLYRTLYENSSEDQILIFDDCDSVFKDPISENILKAALDSYDSRVISWVSQAAENAGLPASFEFKGKIIFISNLQESRIAEPVKSRCFCANIHLTRQETIERMRALATKMEPSISITIKNKVLAYMEKNADSFRNLTLRTFIKAVRIAKACPKDWEKMIAIYS